MKVYADLHIHSKYSRATSKSMDIKELSKYAKIKGIDVLGTGDFTHPLWLKELKENLHGEEILESDNHTKFILGSELSLIYSQDGRGRRVHNVMLAPNFEVVDQINEWLLTKGRLDYDGRPIFGFDCPTLVENMMSISRDIMVIPAHIWTSWFSLFGSKSGFDRIEDCYKDQTKHIHALETGLSSDPSMNWRVSALDKYALVSNSDCHSPYPYRLGREGNYFDLKNINYQEIIQAIRDKDPNKFTSTIEFFPEEGKYHYTGHRNCNVSLAPEEALRRKNICPICKKELTVGVLQRVEELADRPIGYQPVNAIPFKKLIPLQELISGATGSPVMSKNTWKIYFELINRFSNEMNILLDAPEEELVKVTDNKLANLIIKCRNQEIEMIPGYDGLYGKLILNGKTEEKLKPKQMKIQTDLDDFF